MEREEVHEDALVVKTAINDLFSGVPVHVASLLSGTGMFVQQVIMSLPEDVRETILKSFIVCLSKSILAEEKIYEILAELEGFKNE